VQNTIVERARRLLVQTDRDAVIVGWIGGLGAAGAEHVMSRFQMGRSWAYERLPQLTKDGLLEQQRLLYGKPGPYIASKAGLRWRGLKSPGGPPGTSWWVRARLAGRERRRRPAHGAWSVRLQAC
jgi:hypothetical protein